MKCTDFEHRLNQLLDDRLAPQNDAALNDHAAACAECREVLAAHESLFRGLAALNHRTVSPEFGKQVLREFNTPLSQLAPPPRHRGWLPLVATAAAVMLAVGLSVWIVNRNRNPRLAEQPAASGNHGNLAIIKPGHRRPRGTPAPAPLVAPQPVTPQPEAIVVQPRPLSPMGIPSAEESEAYRQAMASLASQWSTNAQWPHVETIDVEQYAPGIRPIRESFEVALDALLRTIPAGKKETRPAPPQAHQLPGDMMDLA